MSDRVLETKNSRPRRGGRIHSVFLALLLTAAAAFAEDQRQLVTLPEPARETLRQEMIDNLIAINEILTLVAADKIKDAGEVAERKLGLSSQGRHRDKPFEARPGPHMPTAMHALGMNGHRAASEFASAAQAGNREQALALLPNLTGSCLACHLSYRTR
jgi:ABC-type transport system involved in cytochrome bd biosynthesis fused ATPase/permease subunit